MSTEAILEEVRNAIVEGDVDQTAEVFERAIAAKIDPMALVSEGIGGAMKIVGERWDCKEYFLPDVLAAVEAVKTGTEILKPHLKTGNGGSLGTMVIGTVKGDIHAIGKNLVATFMEMAGFEVHNIGEDAPAEKFVEAAIKYKADVVGASAFVTTVAEEMTRIIAGLKEKGIRDKILVMVGGCVLDPTWAEKIGADAFAKDAMQAVEMAKAYVAKKKG